MEKQINYILENFNFEKVKQVMGCLKWTYYDSPNIPSIYTLVKLAENLLSKASEKEDIVVGSGGFEAENVKGKLSLKFVVESWDNYD